MHLFIFLDLCLMLNSRTNQTVCEVHLQPVRVMLQMVGLRKYTIAVGLLAKVYERNAINMVGLLCITIIVGLLCHVYERDAANSWVAV